MDPHPSIIFGSEFDLVRDGLLPRGHDGGALRFSVLRLPHAQESGAAKMGFVNQLRIVRMDVGCQASRQSDD